MSSCWPWWKRNEINSVEDSLYRQIERPSISGMGETVIRINYLLEDLSYDERVEVISSLAYCIHCGDEKRGKPCNCTRDE